VSIREDALAYVADHEGKTATEIARHIGRNVASVSSCLRLLCQNKELQRLEGGGPRGGYIYLLPRKGKPKKPGKKSTTAWAEILKKDDFDA